MSVLRNIAAAWQLLLTLPLPADVRDAKPGAWLWLPGLIAGSAIAGMGWTVRWLPATAAAALMLFTELLLTGGIHLDGWADCWDGWGCRYCPEKRRAAVKDSRIGSLGAAALGVLLLLKFSLYTNLAGAFVLIPAHMASRAVLTAAARLFPCGDGGLGAGFVKGIAPWHPWINLLAAAAAFYLTSGLAGIIALGVGLTGALAWARYFAPLAGGLSGDVLGGAQEIALVLALLVMVVTA